MVLLVFNYDVADAEYAFIPLEVLLLTIDMWCIKLAFSNRSISLGNRPKPMTIVTIIFAILSALSTLALIYFFQQMLSTMIG